MSSIPLPYLYRLGLDLDVFDGILVTNDVGDIDVILCHFTIVLDLKADYDCDFRVLQCSPLSLCDALIIAYRKAVMSRIPKEKLQRDLGLF